MLYEPSFFDWVNLTKIAEILISVGLGVLSMSLALSLKRRRYLKGGWFVSLRLILTVLTIAALSNAWSTFLLDAYQVKPASFLMNTCLLSLVFWIWGFYRYNVIKTSGQHGFEKILKFLQGEIIRDRSTRARSERVKASTPSSTSN